MTVFCLFSIISLVFDTCASGSVGRARPCQGRGRGFESRLALEEQKRISDLGILFLVCAPWARSNKKIFTQKVQHQEFIHKLDEFMEHHNDEVEDQDEQIMGILKYLTEWLVNHILYVDGQIPKG